MCLAVAEANINATFEFAQRLVRAKDPQEMAVLQKKVLQQQFERVKTQMQEAGGAAARTAVDSGRTARPKG
jgi:phasin family protein